ncbi:MAG: hypothetical protein KJO41_09190 [Bacteroidia bacterium]|nr:hypothetical protein [Bacteroidia bacterium]NND25542.1 hypothetical protein [Flavobacteriaceae bacterium]MBT8279165.1 hypothetical protein [Bacteroidia bacterium]NNK60853.1 hypothetical protein [Flavobacteriaceae bacterium]NNL33856.1 hypothetical protein [Flavobacteriaceae bacterium]
MKKLIFFLFLISFSLNGHAQETYTVNGEMIELKTEADGSIDLLWNIIDNRYRYFVRKNDQIIELVNTKGSDKKFQEEYKDVLNELVSGSNLNADKVNLTLFSLRRFIDEYNLQVDPNYSSSAKDAKIETRLLIFGGVTNSPFVENPENITNPLFGAELELFEVNNLPRHSLFLQVKHVLSNDDFKYSITQFGVGYRFRIINQRAFNFYANVIPATFNFSKNEFMSEETTVDESGSSFDAPFIFGVGADFRISDNSFITVTYDELFALFLDNQGNFSNHLALGFKLNL